MTSPDPGPDPRQMPPPPQGADALPGWYRDPHQAAQLRYWGHDGWSVFGSTDGQHITAVPTESLHAPEQARRDARRMLVLLVTIMVLALVVLTALWGWFEPSEGYQFGAIRPGSAGGEGLLS